MIDGPLRDLDRAARSEPDNLSAAARLAAARARIGQDFRLPRALTRELWDRLRSTAVAAGLRIMPSTALDELGVVILDRKAGVVFVPASWDPR